MGLLLLPPVCLEGLPVLGLRQDPFVVLVHFGQLRSIHFGSLDNFYFSNSNITHWVYSGDFSSDLLLDGLTGEQLEKLSSI